MEYMVIILVIVFFIGSVSFSMPSKRSKQIAQLRLDAVKLGCKIYHGPYISNFKEIYRYLREKKIACEISNEIDLSQNLIEDFNNKKLKNKRIIDEINLYGEQILDLTTKEILRLSKWKLKNLSFGMI